MSSDVTKPEEWKPEWAEPNQKQIEARINDRQDIPEDWKEEAQQESEQFWYEVFEIKPGDEGTEPLYKSGRLDDCEYKFNVLSNSYIHNRQIGRNGWNLGIDRWKIVDGTPQPISLVKKLLMDDREGVVRWKKEILVSLNGTVHCKINSNHWEGIKEYIRSHYKPYPKDFFSKEGDLQFKDIADINDLIFHAKSNDWEITQS